MKPGAVFVDVAVDQGGYGETTKVTYRDVQSLLKTVLFITV